MHSFFYLNHLYILSIILCLISGTVTLILSTLVYRLGYLRFRFFIPLYFFSTLNIAGIMARYYIIINLPEQQYFLIKYTIISNSISALAQQVIFPVFVHELFNVSFKRKANTVIALLTSVSAIVLFIKLIDYSYPLEELFADRAILYDYSAMAFAIILYLVILYCIILIAFNYKRIEEAFAKRIARVYLVLALIFYPGLLYENLTGRCFVSNGGYTVIYFIPAFYLILSVIISFYLMQYYIGFLKRREGHGSINGFIKEYSITERESQVVKLLLNGYSNSDICDELSITQNTVKTHLKNLFQKTGARSRTELISIIIREK